MTSLSTLFRTPSLERSMLSSAEALIQISVLVPNLSHLSRRARSSRLGRQQGRMSTKTVILSACLWASKCQRGFCKIPICHMALHVSTGQWNSRDSQILWAKCLLRLSSRSNRTWASYESLTDADLYHPPVCLVVSLVVYSLCWCSHCILIH